MSELELLDINAPISFDDHDDDIVIVGMGAVCAVGADVESGFREMLRSRSGVTRERIPGMAGPIRVGRVRGVQFQYDPIRRDPALEYGNRAAKQALKQAFGYIDPAKGYVWCPDESRAAFLGVLSKGAVSIDYRLREAFRDGMILADDYYATWMNNVPPGRFTDTLAGELNLGGIRRCPIAACATGPLLLHVASGLFQEDAGLPFAVVVSAESSVVPLYLRAFESMRVLAHPDDDIMRPFSENRTGFHIGEGASAMVICRRRYAKSNGLNILATLAATAVGCDSSHITSFDISGEPVARVAAAALKRAGVQPDQLGYVNAHATATRRNDILEAAALKRLFGEAAFHIPVSGTKPYTGHLLGASGLLEAVWCVRALQERVAPPNIGLDQIDSACEGLRLVQGQPEFILSPVAMSLNFGFGGHIGVVVVRI